MVIPEAIHQPFFLKIEILCHSLRHKQIGVFLYSCVLIFIHGDSGITRIMNKVEEEFHYLGLMLEDGSQMRRMSDALRFLLSVINLRLCQKSRMPFASSMAAILRSAFKTGSGTRSSM
jgi:hypothetical protein